LDDCKTLITQTLNSYLFCKSSPNLSCGGLTKEQVDSIKYLGVVIDSRLNWDLHIAHADKKVACGSAALYKLQPYVNVDLLRKVYLSIVYCHLHYVILMSGHCKHNHARLSS